MPRRLATQLILSLTFIVVIVGGVAGYITVKTQEQQLITTMILGADQLSRGITSATWQAMLADHRTTAYDVMSNIALQQGISKIRIFNRDGSIMFSSRSEEIMRRVDKSSEVCAVCHASQEPLASIDIPSRARIFRDTDGGRKLAMLTPIYNEPSCSQSACHAHPAALKVLGVLDVELDFDSVDQEVASLQLRVLTVTGIQVVLIGLLTVVFTRRFVTRPIRQLIDGTRAVSEMQLDKPIEIDTSEELGELARSFNRMRERLAQAMVELNEFTQSLESKVAERTEQLKAAHQKLLHTDRLASLGQLAASVAHEINNPVSGVLNLSMLMQRILKDDGIPPGRISEFRRYLTQVINETTRVGRIVSDLLAFSRRSKPQRTVADLNGIVKSTLELVSHKLELAKVRIATELDDRLPVLWCDASQIQQVVINLVLNGAEATQGKGCGTITIRTHRSPVSDAVILEVQDSGDGIPEQNLSKIFDPFFTTKGGKGSGLGLAVVYGIVKAHGGDIEVQSTAGEGTKFRVTLPLQGEERPTGDVPEVEPAVSRGANGEIQSLVSVPEDKR